jgi:hypothetical protein
LSFLKVFFGTSYSWVHFQYLHQFASHFSLIEFEFNSIESKFQFDSSCMECHQYFHSNWTYFHKISSFFHPLINRLALIMHNNTKPNYLCVCVCVYEIYINISDLFMTILYLYSQPFYLIILIHICSSYFWLLKKAIFYIQWLWIFLIKNIYRTQLRHNQQDVCSTCD